MCKGSTALTFDQVFTLINLSYGIPLHEARSTTTKKAARINVTSPLAERGLRSSPLAERGFLDIANSVDVQVLAHLNKREVGGLEADVPTNETMDEMLENEEEKEEPVIYTEDDAKFAEDILKCKKKGDLHGIFTLIETDGDGDLSSRELKRAVERVLNLQLTDQEAQDMFADADWDSGGSISETEWCLYLGRPGHFGLGGKGGTGLSKISEERVQLVAFF